MTEYLVIGYYRENGDRWADSYEADSPEDAEKEALEDNPDIRVAGVVTLVDGKMEVVG